MLANHPKIRLGLYVGSVALGVISPIIAVAAPEYGAAIATAAGVLAAAAGATALTNLSPQEGGDAQYEGGI